MLYYLVGIPAVYMTHMPESLYHQNMLFVTCITDTNEPQHNHFFLNITVPLYRAIGVHSLLH